MSMKVVRSAAVLGWLLGCSSAFATLPMRPGTLRGCVLQEFILASEGEFPETIYEVAEFETSTAEGFDWKSVEGKLVEIKYRSGHIGARPTARFATQLSEPPSVVGPCPPAVLDRLTMVLAFKADERARDINPFDGPDVPLKPRELAAANYAVDLIGRAIKMHPQSCRLHVWRAFILDRIRRPDEALAELNGTRRILRCDPIFERVERRNHPSARLPVEEASDAETEAHERTHGDVR